MKKRSAVSPDINVTPLVDVVLVLLIIFMVVAPQMEQDAPVELPGIFNPDPEAENQIEPFKVSVSSSGEFFFEQEKYDLEGAIEVLGWKHAEEPHRRLVLRADKRLTYREVRDILARAQKVGFPGMSLLVGEKNRPGTLEAQSPSEEPADSDQAKRPPPDEAEEG